MTLVLEEKIYCIINVQIIININITNTGRDMLGADKISKIHYDVHRREKEKERESERGEGEGKRESIVASQEQRRDGT